MGRIALGLALWLASAQRALAGEVHVAVAQNFAPVARELGAAFERSNGGRVILSAASSGKLYAQIDSGAPFDVFLSADAERPARLESEGLATAGSRFTYALGRLVLWSADLERVDPGGKVLEGEDWRHLAIANPELAPYGAAAAETLRGLGLWERVASRLVRGEDVGQAFQFVVSGNAELGFVALSQLADGQHGGSRWLVPESLHAPIEQQAVLLARAAENATARAFLAFLRSAQAHARISQAGYGAP
jgi:molybdate transport system substrate-binding protein